MKKFLIKGIIFVVLLVLIIFTINFKYINTDFYKNFLTDTIKFEAVPDNVQIVNLGSSHSRDAFNYDGNDVVGFNFALSAQGFYYDYRVLMQFSDKLANNAVVLIPISYFSFYQDYNGEEFRRSNIRYYRFLETEYVKDFSYFKLLGVRFLPVFLAGKSIRFIFNFINYTEVEYKIKTREEMKLSGYGQATNQINSVIKGGKDNIDETTKELENIIRFCKEKGFIPVLVTTPFTEYYNKHFSEEFCIEFYGMVNNIKDDYNLVYLDYSRDVRFLNNIDLFRNADHLNSTGSEFFTKIVLDDLAGLKILE